MGIETLLLESGAVLAIALILGLYNELSSRSITRSKTTLVTNEPIYEQRTTSKPSYENESSHQTPTMSKIPRFQNAMISEAPAPFADESFSAHKTRIPTDVTATSNILTHSVGTAAALIIPVPKKRRAVRRSQSSSDVHTRRRVARSKRNVIGTSSAAEQPNLSTQQTD